MKPKKGGLKKMMVPLAIVLVVVGLVFFFRKQIMKFINNLRGTCSPSDDQKKAAGGDGVLTFKLDQNGNCVAATCNTAAGYMLSTSNVCVLCNKDNTSDIDKGYTGVFDDTYPAPMTLLNGETCYPNYITFSGYTTEANCSTDCSGDKTLQGYWGGSDCYMGSDGKCIMNNKMCVCTQAAS
jgi:hypothetical protein